MEQIFNHMNLQVIHIGIDVALDFRVNMESMKKMRILTHKLWICDWRGLHFHLKDWLLSSNFWYFKPSCSLISFYMVLELSSHYHFVGSELSFAIWNIMISIWELIMKFP